MRVVHQQIVPTEINSCLFNYYSTPGLTDVLLKPDRCYIFRQLKWVNTDEFPHVLLYSTVPNTHTHNTHLHFICSTVLPSLVIEDNNSERAKWEAALSIWYQQQHLLSLCEKGVLIMYSSIGTGSSLLYLAFVGEETCRKLHSFFWRRRDRRLSVVRSCWCIKRFAVGNRLYDSNLAKKWLGMWC